MTTTRTEWALCYCDDAMHEYPDACEWDTDRGVAEMIGLYIPGIVPRHLLRLTSLTTIDVIVHAEDADPERPVGEIPPTCAMRGTA
jgi:hypothetical protein